MRDIKADWKRWSAKERLGAVSIIAISGLVYLSTIVQALAG